MNRRRSAVIAILAIVALVVLAIVAGQLRHQSDLARFEERAIGAMASVVTVLSIESSKLPLQLLSIEDLNRGVHSRAPQEKNPWTGGRLRVVDLRDVRTAEPGDFVFGFDHERREFVLGVINPDKKLVLVTPIDDFEGGGE